MAGRTEATLVVFGDSGARPLLGAYALEGLQLAVAPVGRCLVPVPGLVLGHAALRVPYGISTPA